MKTLSLAELQRIANTFGAELIDQNALPVLDFGNYGFETTENYDGKFGGFRYFGESAYQQQLLPVWDLLTNPKVQKPMLTVDFAKTLIGKKVRCSYCDVNQGEEIFEIIGLTTEKSKQIGQNENYKLLTVSVTQNGKYILPYIDQFFQSKDGKVFRGLNWSWDAKIDIDKGIVWRITHAEYKQTQAPTINELVKTGDLQLITTSENKPEPSDWCYEWQGIFRRGSGAERLFIEEVYD